MAAMSHRSISLLSTPTNVSPGLTAALKIVTDWRPVRESYITKIDDNTVLVRADYGDFSVNGVPHSVNEVYYIRPSTHTYKDASMVMEINVIGKSASGATTTIIMFGELENMEEYDVFLYTNGFGTGETAEMTVGATRRNYDTVDMEILIPQPTEDETYFHYPGSSLWGNCGYTYYVIYKTTILMNRDQLSELKAKQSNYPVNPFKIVVFDSKKPPVEPEKKPYDPNKDPIPDPKPTNDLPDKKDPEKIPDKPPNPPTPDKLPTKPDSPKDPKEPTDNLVFNPPLYNQTYYPYPPPRNNTPPTDTEEYPSPEFPYPDVWPWTGEPNFPYDPWYPLYVFPPQPICLAKNPGESDFWPVWDLENRLPKCWPKDQYPPNYKPEPYYQIPEEWPLVPYDVFYEYPIYPDQSPQWPFGFPIWPEPGYPVWPQNQDFFPKEHFPPSSTMPQDPKQKPNPSSPQNPQDPNNPQNPQNTNNPQNPSDPKNPQNPNDPNAPKQKDPKDRPIHPFDPNYYTPLRYPFVIHPMLPVPIYTYLPPYTTYPRFPSQHFPDDPFYPMFYPGYPESPNDTVTPMKPPKKVYPTDPKLKWPQNPYYTWPTSPHFRWPEDQRFIWPQDPKEPQWIWPKDPTKDPKWKPPADPSQLPPPLPQRWPWDPVKPDAPINNTLPPNLPPGSLIPVPVNVTNGTVIRVPEDLSWPRREPEFPGAVFVPISPNPVNGSVVVIPPGKLSPLQLQPVTIILNVTKPLNQPLLGPQFYNPLGDIRLFSIPNVTAPPKPRPGFSFPDPTHLIMMPHTGPPFPVEHKYIPRVYKGVPNQPFGIIPPNAIPFWKPISPKIYVIVQRSPPPAPLGTKWIPYFYYPLPFKTETSGRIGLVPQYILVPHAYILPTAQPVYIPILILPLRGWKPPSPIRIPNRPWLITYQMPIILRPVDPTIRYNIKLRIEQILANQARFDINMLLIDWNPKKPNVTVPVPDAAPVRPVSPPTQGPNNTKPDNKTIITDPDGKPIKELIGYDTVCDKWKIHVLVNRHFKHAFEWAHADYDEEELGGSQRYCIAWRRIPRFRDIVLNSSNGSNSRASDNKNGTNPGNSTGPSEGIGFDPSNGKPELNFYKVKMDVPCDSELSIVLNDRKFDMPKDVKDSIIKKCSVWVNTNQQLVDYKKRQEEIAKRMQTKAITQLAFLKMVPLKYDD